jgi:hypothetical protein
MMVLIAVFLVPEAGSSSHRREFVYKAARKTCDAMQSCIAASQGSPSLANPLGACAEPCFSRSGKWLLDPASYVRIVRK